MENGCRDDALTLTTESPRGIAIRLFMVFALNLPSIILNISIIISPGTAQLPTATSIVALNAIVGLSAMLLAISLFLWWLVTWGTWVLDADGIEFYPRFGRYRRLQWDEVEWVCWQKWRVSLRGSRARISIPWEWLPRAQVEQGRWRIEGILSPKFDLKVGSPTLWPLGPPALFARIPRLFGIAVVATAIWLGVGFWIVNHAPLPGSRRLDAFCLWSMLLVLTPFCWVGSQYQRAQRLVHPEWPWRGRRIRHAEDDQ